MELWRKYFRKTSVVGPLKKAPLDELAAGGVEVVIFNPRSNSGKPCSIAMQLAGGRIPITLAEPVPLQGCDNIDGCDCEYKL